MTQGAPVTDAETRDLLWKQYSLHVDLYKFYLDLTIKLNVFYYAITGGILTFYFGHPRTGALRFSLVLPMLMSAAFSWLFFRSADLLKVTREEVFRIRDALGLFSAPELGVLGLTLRIFGSLFALTAAAMLVLLVFRTEGQGPGAP